MSEEMREELQENEVVETMADYEDHIDDANPWNRVTEYMEKKTVLPVKVEGVVKHPSFPLPISKILKRIS